MYSKETDVLLGVLQTAVPDATMQIAILGRIKGVSIQKIFDPSFEVSKCSNSSTCDSTLISELVGLIFCGLVGDQVDKTFLAKFRNLTFMTCSTSSRKYQQQQWCEHSSSR
jgi:hypothetical protein